MNGTTNGTNKNGFVPQTEEELLDAAEKFYTKPLWKQMAKLNPPQPNPRCTPHIWRYDEIRPSLIRAGELVSEKQAERRVLMLINPSRGNSKRTTRSLLILRFTPRCSIYH